MTQIFLTAQTINTHYMLSLLMVHLKWLEKLRGQSSPHQNKGKDAHNNTCLQTLSFRYTVPVFLFRLCPVCFYLWGQFRPYS